jgi:hypothetical protein
VIHFLSFFVSFTGFKHQVEAERDPCIDIAIIGDWCSLGFGGGGRSIDGTCTADRVGIECVSGA